MGEAAKKHPAKRPIKPFISAIDNSNLSRVMDGLDLYAICICSDSIRTIRAEMNGQIGRSAHARQKFEKLFKKKIRLSIE